MNKSKTWSDPIVDEVHRTRKQLLKEAGGSLRALGKWLMEQEKDHADRLVSRQPRRLSNKKLR